MSQKVGSHNPTALGCYCIIICEFLVFISPSTSIIASDIPVESLPLHRKHRPSVAGVAVADAAAAAAVDAAFEIGAEIYR